MAYPMKTGRRMFDRRSTARTSSRQAGSLRRRRCVLEALEARSMLSAGIVTSSFTTSSDGFNGGLVQEVTENGAAVSKFVAVGISSGDFSIARYNPDGGLDTTFGNQGVTISNVSGTWDGAQSVACSPVDKKLVVGGTAHERTAEIRIDFMLARYTPDGRLDTSFGSKGAVRTDWGGNDVLRSVAVTPDGKIYAGGLTDAGSQGFHAALARYTAGGRLDTSFDGDGRRLGPALGDGGRIALWTKPGTSETRVLQIGQYFDTSQVAWQIVVICYHLDGTLDPTFGTRNSAGQVIEPGIARSPAAWGSMEAGGIAVDRQGNLLVAGLLTYGGDWSVARLLPTGVWDLGFGEDGLVVTDAPSYPGDVTTSLAWAIQADPDSDRFVVTGCTGHADGSHRFAAALYNGSGVLQWWRDTPIGSESEGAGVAFLPSGSVVVAGSATLPTGGRNQYVAALASYDAATGDPSPGFGPGLSIGNAVVDEGSDTASFTVFLDGVYSAPVSVDFTTLDGTAVGGTDYSPVGGTLTFEPNVTVQTVTVPLVDDGMAEATERFYVRLSAAAGAPIANPVGTATIVDDEPQLPILTISDVSQKEGDSGTTEFTFTVTLSSPSTGPISVDYATHDGSATAPSDYTAVSGTLSFAAGETSKTIRVEVFGDVEAEEGEQFVVNLTNPIGAAIGDGQGLGTILDNDFVLPTLSVTGVSLPEGNSRTKSFPFTVTLSAPSSQVVTVAYTTVSGTATTTNRDYKAASGTLTFLAGETSKTIAVAVVGDTTVEPNETFYVRLSDAVNGKIVAGEAQGIILNDDGAATARLSSAVSDAAMLELLAAEQVRRGTNDDSGTKAEQRVVDLALMEVIEF